MALSQQMVYLIIYTVWYIQVLFREDFLLSLFSLWSQIPETDALRNDGNGRSISPARSGSPSRRRRLRSPGRAVSPSFANSTYDAVAGSLQKRQLQVQELKAKLEASQDAGTALRQKYALAETQIADLEDQINATKKQLDQTITEKNDAKRDIDRNQASIETFQAEKDGLRLVSNFWAFDA